VERVNRIYTRVNATIIIGAHKIWTERNKKWVEYNKKRLENAEREETEDVNRMKKKNEKERPQQKKGRS
jgi:hypothetical protein